MHSAVLTILEGICYYDENNNNNGNNHDSSAPLLSLESLRPVTGMLLPKLYPNDDGAGKGNVKGQQHQQRAAAAEEASEQDAMLWKVILMLLTPYSDESLGEDGKRRCKNWYVDIVRYNMMLCGMMCCA